MKILVAEDDAVTRRILEGLLTKWGYEVIATSDGTSAWDRLRETPDLSLAILDWQMPGMDGVEVCRLAREFIKNRPLHLLMLTIRKGTNNVVEGLGAGADDYITKPFVPDELKARVEVGARVVSLQIELATRLAELEKAMAKVRRLQCLLPICARCKKVRNDNTYWQDVETYLMEFIDIQFSHGICPSCYSALVTPPPKQG